MKEFTLQREFAEHWIEALRGCKYKQARFKLVNTDGAYCCLGVACTIDGVQDTEMQNYNDTFFTEALLHTTKYFDNKNDLVIELVEMNDKKQLSFIEIADWIESNVEFI